MTNIEEDQKIRYKERSLYFDELESEIIEDERKLIELTNFVNEIDENLEHYHEKLCVFDKVSQLLSTDSNILNALDLYIYFIKKSS